MVSGKSRRTSAISNGSSARCVCHQVPVDRASDAEFAKHVGAARDREAGRHRVPEAAIGGAVPALDEVLRLAQGSLEDRLRIDGRVVGDPIHHHLAEDRPDPVRLGGLERRVHRGLVDHAVGEHGGGAGGRERLEDGRGETCGDGRIRPRSLGREREAVEPGQQVQREADSGVRHLRQVRVGVDHAGHEDPRPDVDRGDQHVPWRGGRWPDPGDPARGVDVDERVRFVVHAAGRQRRQQPRPKRERRSLRKLAARHRRRLARGRDAARPAPRRPARSALKNACRLSERGRSPIPTRACKNGAMNHAQKLGDRAVRRKARNGAARDHGTGAPRGRCSRRRE